MAPIGRGGMATVYLGRWLGARDFTKPVAVKALRPQFARDPDFATMLLDEARIASRIRHANVVPTVDVVDDDGEIFIVMEYFEALTLRRLVSLLKTGTHVPLRVALRIMSGVLQGLHAAHESTDARGESLGILHRDVSPENVLVCVDGHARLIDFGIARARERFTATPSGIVKGKLAYLSPEQVLSETVDRRTDIYSASIVLWELLVGRKLFTGTNMLEAAEDILRAEIPAPSSLRERIPESIDRIVARGLARKPERRFKTAELMAAAIEAVGPVATHREVGAWVRRVASPQLRKIEHLIQEAEKVPFGAMSGVRSRPRAAAPQEPSLEIDVTFADASRWRARLIQLGVATLILLAVVSTAMWLLSATGESPRGSSERVVPEPVVESPPPPLPRPTGVATVSVAPAASSLEEEVTDLEPPAASARPRVVRPRAAPPAPSSAPSSAASSDPAPRRPYRFWVPSGI